MDPQSELTSEQALAELDALIGSIAISKGPPTPAAAEPEASRPTAPTAPKAEQRQEALTAAGSPLRILLVDDSKDYRKILGYLFTSSGYSVAEARDGAEGLSAARKTPPDLVLLDFDMPGINGYEFLQELRSSEETRKIPVIMLTGASKRRHLHELNMDLSIILNKPIANDDLLAAVSRTLGCAPSGGSSERAADDTPALAIERIATISSPPPADDPKERLETAEDGDAALDGEIQIEEPKKEREEDVAGLDVLCNDSPLVNRINHILIQAVEMGASDIHIEPQERSTLVRVRVDGNLKVLSRLPAALQPQVAARIKIMSNLTITERRRPQDGQVRATIKGRRTEFRVSTIPSIYGEKIVLRILGGAKLKENLAELQLRSQDLEVVSKALKSPHGLILVTGPTGSGKTTTLYTLLRQLNTPDVNIMTAEDPVEYELDGITQVQVRAPIGVTFEAVLRSFLRQDPDIMLVGEIRDLETAEIAVKAAVTGHVVFSTLHTNSAPAAVIRLAHMGVARYLVADSTKLIVAQRLVRRICLSCRAAAVADEETLRLIGADHAEKLAKACVGRGCPACGRTGYSGRLPLFEVMAISSPQMRHLIISNASLDELTKQSSAEGMRSLRDAALDAVASGETTIEEALSILLST